MFVLGDKGCEIERYRIYRDKILIPFIKNQCKTFYGCKGGDNIPVNLMAVFSSDGAMSQIQKIISSESLQIYRDNMITANKQNPQQTGTEQSVDLTKNLSCNAKTTTGYYFGGCSSRTAPYEGRCHSCI